jgi:hypothetical protein
LYYELFVEVRVVVYKILVSMDWKVLLQFAKVRTRKAMLGGSLVTTAWHVLGLRMEGNPLGTEGNCEYTE